ncbi:hypothetical protein BJ508DRAFT_335454 [Ascobolus immersus RN42]|uniref:Uncharacterized protein n=1 Tax=Ascobolus immersus RN42 TaxID=1160509 RepID=A0A3N4HCF4_ASCIM|nr:hypothetical protein BJ508DRAFT_335454 [Ascobolus immersus RN42]
MQQNAKQQEQRIAEKARLDQERAAELARLKRLENERQVRIQKEREERDRLLEAERLKSAMEEQRRLALEKKAKEEKEEKERRDELIRVQARQQVMDRLREKAKLREEERRKEEEQRLRDIDQKIKNEWQGCRAPPSNQERSRSSTTPKTPRATRRVIGQTGNSRPLYAGSSLKFNLGSKAHSPSKEQPPKKPAPKKQTAKPSVKSDSHAATPDIALPKGWIALANKDEYHPSTPIGDVLSRPVRNRTLSSMGRASQEYLQREEQRKLTSSQQKAAKDNRKNARASLNVSDSSAPPKRW